MTILYRYISKEIARLFFIILIFVVTLYVVIDFIDRSGKFVQSGLPINRILIYFVYNVPSTIVLIIPLGFLMSVLIAVGMMAKNNEILALRCSGIGTYSMLKPVITMGLLTAIVLFFLSESVAPSFATRARDIWLKEVKKKNIAVSQGRMDVWIRGDQTISHIKYIEPSETLLSRVTIYRLSDSFRLIERVDAKMAEYLKGVWKLSDVMVQRLNKEKNGYDVTIHDSLEKTLDFLPSDLSRGVKSSEEMNVYELWKYIRKVKREGYDATTYIVDFHSKIAKPFSCLILGVLALGLAARNRATEGIMIVVVSGLGAAFTYFVLFSFTVTLGYGGYLLPVVAAWLSNILFLGLSGALLFRADG